MVKLSEAAHSYEELEKMTANAEDILQKLQLPYRVMAMKVLMENPQAYGFRLRDDQLYQPRKYKTVDVSGPVASWPDWAKAHGTTYAQLRDANPWIRALKLTNKTGKTYKVRVPLSESLSRSKAGYKTYDSRWTVK